MKVKVSKVMADTLNKEAKRQNKLFHFFYTEMDYEHYRYLVDFDVIDHANDYNVEKDILKVIKIVYPDNCYCSPNYLTTNDLTKMAQNAKNSYEEFINNVFDNVEI